MLLGCSILNSLKSTHGSNVDHPNYTTLRSRNGNADVQMLVMTSIIRLPEALQIEWEEAEAVGSNLDDGSDSDSSSDVA